MENFFKIIVVIILGLFSTLLTFTEISTDDEIDNRLPVIEDAEM